MNAYQYLLDIAPVTAPEYAAIEDRCREVLGTEQTTFVFQGEAIVALEAAARGLGRPGRRALNLVSGPYGATFGDWLVAGGAEVQSLAVPFDQAVTPELVTQALERSGPVDLVSVVHAEAATGVVNDLAGIARAAKAHGALVVVDAVASVGAEELLIDPWDLDLVVLSAQKALSGPAGATVVVVSAAAWAALADHPAPWRGSVLSLLDWRDRWAQAGRAVLPTLPANLETRALGAAMERVAEEGLALVVARHRAAGAAVRAALGPLGLELWPHPAGRAASVATLFRPPAQGSQALVKAALTGLESVDALPRIACAPAPLADDAVRVSHTGRRANRPGALGAVAALAQGMGILGYPVDTGATLAAAAGAWAAAYGEGT